MLRIHNMENELTYIGEKNELFFNLRIVVNFRHFAMPYRDFSKGEKVRGLG